MLRTIIVGLSTLLISISASSPTYAQPPVANVPESQIVIDEEEFEDELRAFTERRIEVVKATLGLTPSQEQYWPAIEQAIRARGASRQQRLAQLAALRNESSPLEILKVRADNLMQRAVALKKLVDAWGPLYQTLDDRQKVRLRFLTVYVLREMRSVMDSRRMQSFDEDED
jgi:LTXXQ motif family protein